MKKIRRYIILYAGLLAVVCLLCAASAVLAGAEAPKATVDSFSVKCTSAGRDYFYEGQPFSAEGYEGTVIYSDGTRKTIPASELTCTVADPLVPNADPTKKVHVFFSCSETDITSGVPITVVPLKSLKTSGNYKTTYRSGEDFFDPTGLEIWAVYEDTIEFPVDLSACRFSLDSNVPVSDRDTSVSVSYTIGSHTVSADIQLIIQKVVSVNVTKVPDKKYYEGSLFSCENDELEVTAVFDGETEPVKVINWDVTDAGTPLIADADGKASLTVEIGGKTAAFKVDVIKLESVAATSKTLYQLYPGDIFNPEAIKITAKYADGTEKNVSEEVDYEYPEMIVCGSTVKASYAGRDIPLEGVVLVHSATLSIIKAPTKSEYRVGEVFDPSGMLIGIKYDDGTVPGKNPSVEDCVLSVPEVLGESDCFAKVSYLGFEAECPFKVYSDRRVSRIEIVTPPNTLRYVTGQLVNIDGISVNVYYEGETEPETVGADRLSTVPETGSPISDDMHSITVRYKVSETVYYDATQIIEVTKKVPKMLFINDLPAIDMFYEGSVFNPDGLRVSVIYNDGTTLPVEDYTLSRGDEPFVLSSNDTYQDVTITVFYGELSADFKVTVLAKKVKSLTLLSLPEKTIYRIGETFDPTGLKVLLTYTDTNISPVLLDKGDYVVTPSGRLSADDNHAYVAFRGLTATIDIEVNASGTHEESSAPIDTGVFTLPPPITTSPDNPGFNPDTSYTPIVTSPAPNESSSSVNTVPVTPDTTGGNTSGGHRTGGGIGTITVLWIVVIGVIFLGIIGLIIYYRRHFT